MGNDFRGSIYPTSQKILSCRPQLMSHLDCSLYSSPFGACDHESLPLRAAAAEVCTAHHFTFTARRVQYNTRQSPECQSSFLPHSSDAFPFNYTLVICLGITTAPFTFSKTAGQHVHKYNRMRKKTDGKAFIFI